MNLIKAITIWQPWASLLACGAKKYETRSWPTKYRGPIAIHAAQKPLNTRTYFDRELYPFAAALDLPDIFSFNTLPYGCIIATAELVDCHVIRSYIDETAEACFYRGPDNYELIAGNELLFGDWAPGRYAWELANVQVLREPIPVKGRQGLWNWDSPGQFNV